MEWDGWGDCVYLVEATPDEAKSGGAGWIIRAGFAPTPFGICLLGESPRGICHLSFVEPSCEVAAWAALASEWPGATFLRDDSFSAVGASLFVRTDNDVRTPAAQVLVKGSAFQVAVWRALLGIRAGAQISYGGLARALGRPEAVRAVASAVARNRIAYLIPCHRVIRKSGDLGGFRWGVERKRAMLAWEGERQDAASTPLPARRVPAASPGCPETASESSTSAPRLRC